MAGTAAVAGGGIAGMAAALALARTGWRVRLVERQPALGEAGAGLQLSPNAVRALDWLGLAEPLRARGFAPGAAVMRDGLDGRVILRLPLGPSAGLRWGAPYLHLHRADLLEILADGARAAGVAIETGVRATDYADRAEGITLDCADAQTGETRPSLDADLAVGADGIRSTLRDRLNGRREPDFSGMVAWRALVPAERLPRDLVAPDATVWVGPGRHLVTYLLRGGSLVNLVAVEEAGETTAEGWRQPGDPERLRAGFAGWRGEVTALLDAVDEAWVWGLFTRPEQVRWTQGHMALAGDAAHPMQPFMAQGAAQALEDAVVLARMLAEPGRTVPEAVAAYERRRWPRAARVQARSRANARMFHQRHPLARLLHHGPAAAATRLAPRLVAGRFDWLYGHDVTA
ncbi:MAG TPA: FAD-dependent monooxygenase [Thermohalobaculum sp.]|nr:FAD-dependent monooxygenase [Thermohalobaculum sp.]